MPHFKLISFNLCPFVQRCVMTLREKNADYAIEYIDLTDRPDWFKDISPLGKVPVLEVTRDDGSKVAVFESSAINEYLDEVTEGSLLPSDPLDRAYARAWIEFASSVLVDGFQITMMREQAQVDVVLEKLNKKLDRLESMIGEGPFFLGADVSLVDTSFMPGLQRLLWTEEIDPTVAFFKNRPNLTRWWEALAVLESVKGSAVPELKELFIEMVGRDRGGYRSAIGAKV